MVTLNEKSWMQAWARVGEEGPEDHPSDAVRQERPVDRGPAERLPVVEPLTVECGFCGTEFVEDRSQATCQACPLSKACGLMRCPRCGYENPKQPAWIVRLKEWIR